MVDKVFDKNMLILPDQPYHDDFIEAMTKVFHWARWFGVLCPGSKRWKAWGSILFVSLIAIEIAAIRKVIRALAGWAADTTGHHSVTARLAGTMFYTSAIASLVLSSKLSYSLNSLCSYWGSVQRSVGINLPPDLRLKRQMIIVVKIMTVCSIFEHVMSMVSLVGFDCPPDLILERYTLRSHGFLFKQQEYSILWAIPILVMSNVATALWNFQDALIILVSMGLTSRYRRLNQYVAQICLTDSKDEKGSTKKETIVVYTWRKTREAYVNQAKLVRKVDALMGPMILLSSFGNFYFICLQLFLGITQGINGASIMNLVYYIVSLLWLMVRFTWMVLAAADVNVQSKGALRFVHKYNSRSYNVEVDRLQTQLQKDYVAISGMGFFSINRNILLQMVGAMVTYELVLIQFDNK